MDDNSLAAAAGEISRHSVWVKRYQFKIQDPTEYRLTYEISIDIDKWEIGLCNFQHKIWCDDSPPPR